MNMNDQITNPADQHKLPVRPILWTVGILILAFILTSAIIAFSHFRDLSESPAPNIAPMADFGAVPAFSLLERSEKMVSLEDLKGKVWIADFIFTYCAGPCPKMSLQMAELQKTLPKSANVHFVSFTVDPERDSTARLREYADAYGADPQRWLFLTGAKDTIAALATDGFHSGSKDDPILHSTLFAIVDKKGHIRNYYHSDDPELMKKVAEDVATLAREKST
jgi:cytochrome oxidase Cu insertion factor (SCO1/SenC/PrrC family)